MRASLWRVQERRSTGRIEHHGHRLPITGFAHKATVVGDDRVAARAVLTPRNVPAECRRAAALDGRHYLHLLEADVTAVGITPRSAMIAEDVRDLQARP